MARVELVGDLLYCSLKREIMNKNLTLEDRINQTALEMFSSEGFDSVTVNEICREVGITKPTFYRYVNSKEEILNSYYHIDPWKIDPHWDTKDSNSWHCVQNGFRICYDHYTSLGTEMLSRMMISLITRHEFSFQSSPEWSARIIDLLSQAQQQELIENDLEPEELLNLLISVSVGYCFYTCTEEDDAVGTDEYLKLLATVARAKS